ncbi:CcdB family protein [Aquincola sp. S2]|uniref:Toxin CcdB n=1 Tax=Pseudaquabacterium terrae TaxID=2732868 RepID=A0ABX2EIH3_9BURK|nr:CcdB family protein [Aquabacterium terrae]NRF68371.1 CcdB family protein [Aquabacterium terrae]
MARFDVYATPIRDEKHHTPFWLDVQADHLSGLSTRVVVPLRKVNPKLPPTQRLNPEFVIEGTAVFADVPNLGTTPLNLLRRPVASLRDQRQAIDDALDFLFSGF